MAEIIACDGNELTLQVTIKLSGSLLEMENTILDSCNEIGCLATAEALQRFDTDGSPIKLGDTKMTAREIMGSRNNGVRNNGVRSCKIKIMGSGLAK